MPTAGSNGSGTCSLSAKRCSALLRSAEAFFHVLLNSKAVRDEHGAATRALRQRALRAKWPSHGDADGAINVWRASSASAAVATPLYASCVTSYCRCPSHRAG